MNVIEFQMSLGALLPVELFPAFHSCAWILPSLFDPSLADFVW